MDAVKRLKDAMSADAGRQLSPEVLGTVDHVDASGRAWCLVPGNDELVECASPVTVHHGDVVAVSIVAGILTVTHNYTVPSVNDAQYQHVKDIAEEANELLDGVAEAAASADKTVAEMLDDANTASMLVSGMQDAAETAGTTLAQIVADADEAAGTLAGMQDAATAAHTTLTGIYQDAADANAAAVGALAGLSTLESVVGTVQWFADHRRPSAATAVQAGKTYYSYDQSTGAMGAVEPEGPETPAQEGWYELDSTIQNYVVSHVAETAEGLYVLSLANGWRVLVSSGAVASYPAGYYIIDGNGTVQQSTTAAGVDFNPGKSWHIGSDDAYILYTPATAGDPASIVIGGSRVQLGSSKTLAQWEAELEQAAQDAAAAIDSATLTITSTNGNLFKNGTESTVLQVAVFPNGGDRLDTIEQVRARFGSGAYIEWKWKHENGDWGTLPSSDPHLSQGGMWLTVTPEDVASKTSFSASLVTP